MSKKNSVCGAHLTPLGARPQAAIYMLDGEFLFVAVRDGKIEQKYVSPGALRQAFAAEPIDTGWIPNGVRRWGRGAKGVWMLRWHEPAVYAVWLPGRKRQVKVPFPALIFFAQGNSYYLWATKGQTFDPKARLYNAPCANVSESGLICWGQNPHPDVTIGCFDKMWAIFWEAPFSPNWASGKSRKFPQSANDLLADLAKRGAREYPEDDLTPLKYRLFPTSATLETVIERLTRRGE